MVMMAVGEDDQLDLGGIDESLDILKVGPAIIPASTSMGLLSKTR